MKIREFISKLSDEQLEKLLVMVKNERMLRKEEVRKERIREYSRTYREKNRERLREYGRERAAKNKEKLREQKREWYHANKERLRKAREEKKLLEQKAN